jgi:hypothetical protein
MPLESHGKYEVIIRVEKSPMGGTRYYKAAVVPEVARENCFASYGIRANARDGKIRTRAQQYNVQANGGRGTDSKRVGRSGGVAWQRRLLAHSCASNQNPLRLCAFA